MKKLYAKYTAFAPMLCIMFSSVFVHAMGEIPSPIEHPTHVEFLNNNKIVIAEENGLVFVQLFTNKTTCHHVGKHIQDMCANGSKTKLAISSEGIISVYNTHTEQKEWEYDSTVNNNVTFTPITFNSQKDDELFACMQQENIVRLCTGKVISIPEKITKLKPFTPIVCHPHNEGIFYLAPWDQLQDLGFARIALYHNGISRLLTHAYRLTNLTINNDGSNALASINHRGHFLLDLNDSNYSSSTSGIGSAIFEAHAIHPNSGYFVILEYKSDPPCKLNYFHEDNFFFSTKTYIFPDVDQNIASQTTPKSDIIEKRLVFSPNGNSLLMILADKCFIRSTLLDLNYTQENEKRLYLFLFLLNNNLSITKALPQEIIIIIKQLLINLYQSHTKYNKKETQHEKITHK